MINKNINYINKDFNSFKNKLINFAKTYYPNTYNDFSEASPGMMLIEMVSYVGDVLSLYQENQIQETFLQYSKQRKNLLSQAYVYGYIPKITTVSSTILDVYQLVPSINISGEYLPDYNYCLTIEEGAEVQSSINPQNKFYIEDRIDFNFSSSYDITEVTIHTLDGNNNPEFYLLKKQRNCYSGELKTVNIEINNPEKFKTIIINDNKIIKIKNIIDSDNNLWYEVPYLAQDTIFEKNISNSSLVPYKLSIKKVPRRFITRFKSDDNLEIQFGSGILNISDEEVIPNFNNIGLGLNNGISKMYTAFDPSNFTYTKSYGQSPYNTTLTINYLVGGGIESNTPSNTINVLSNGVVNFNNNVDPVLSNIIINSLTFNNEFPSVGGGDGDSNEDLKLNTIASFPTQLRLITKEDYIIRSLSLPPEFGVVSKVYADKNDEFGNYLSLYILSKNSNNNLTNADLLLKNNLKTYLNEFKTLTESVQILDAFIINIGVNFDIIIQPEYNTKNTIKECISAITNYFNIDKWKINQPILLSEIYTILDKINGVQNVKNIEIYNISGDNSNYSKYSYDIKSATINNIIYPSMDPCIFELKNPEINIKGRSSIF